MKRILFLVLISQVFFSYGQCQKINFEKIIFYASPCFGSCPVYHLELDSSKKIMLHAVDFMRPNISDTTKIGYFTGIADNSLFNRVINILTSAGIENLQSQIDDITDIQDYTITIYYAGEKKQIKIRSLSASKNMENLISTLLTICKNGKVQRTGKFHIEGDDD